VSRVVASKPVSQMLTRDLFAVGLVEI